MKIFIRKTNSDAIEEYRAKWHGVSQGEPAMFIIGFDEEDDYPVKLIKFDIIEDIYIEIVEEQND